MASWYENLFHQSDSGERTGAGDKADFPWPQKKTQPVATGGGTASGTSLSGNWWDLGMGGGQPMQFKAPTVSAPNVKAPKMPTTPEVIPGYYGNLLQQPGEEGPVNEFTKLIEQISGREVSQAPVPKVDDTYINQLLSQYGIQPKSAEEIQEYAQAIVDRQKYGQEQILMREIDRFERDFPNEFRQVEKMITESAAAYSAGKQEEMSARGMFYSSIMSSAVESVDRELVQVLGDIARDAANRVSDMRGDIKDLAQWAILEEEVIRREIEEVEDGKRRQLMAMHLEVATWADQMALDAWYKQESIQLQSDQLQLQAIELQMHEAERMGQHLATAFMADHPLVQQTMMNMGITPEQFAAMPLEQQAATVNSLVNFNDIEQQMRARELQMRAVIAEIQLQNAALQLQAKIANAQFSMEAQKLTLTHMMHQDQMALNWAEFGVNAKMAEWQMSQPRYGSGSTPKPVSAYDQRLQEYMYIQAEAGDFKGLEHTIALARQEGYTGTASYGSNLLRDSRPAPAPSGKADSKPKSNWLQNLISGSSTTGGLDKAISGRTGIR
jgi:hypothetical protein